MLITAVEKGLIILELFIRTVSSFNTWIVSYIFICNPIVGEQLPS